MNDLLNSNAVLTTHVFGLGIDDEVSYRRESLTTPEDIWSHRDDLNSLTSITDETGVVLERYEYGDYGLVTILDPIGVVRSGTVYEATHLYTGRSLMAGTGLYDYRFRVMDPATGRFGQLDPLGTWFDWLSQGGGYVYSGSSPSVYTDPLGYTAGDYGPFASEFDTGNPKDLTWYEWGPSVTRETWVAYFRSMQAGAWPEKRKGMMDKKMPVYLSIYNIGDEKIDSRGNCWRFACNDPTNPGEDPRNFNFPNGAGCSALMAAAISAGALDTNECGSFPEGTRKAAGMVSPSSGDYHWMVDETGNNNWAHKPGDAKVRNTDDSGQIITDPSKSENGEYTQFCGYICIPNGLDTDR